MAHLTVQPVFGVRQTDKIQRPTKNVRFSKVVEIFHGGKRDKLKGAWMKVARKGLNKCNI